MTVLNHTNGAPFDSASLDLTLRSLAIRLEQNGAQPVVLVVCGGSALILSRLIARTTRDVDIVALIRDSELCAPAPMPAELQQAATEVAEDLGLPEDWLNNGPSRDEGGLFQKGLPGGLQERLSQRSFGNRFEGVRRSPQGPAEAPRSWQRR